MAGGRRLPRGVLARRLGLLAVAVGLTATGLWAPSSAGAVDSPAPGQDAAASTGASFTLTRADAASIGLAALPQLESSFASAGVVLHFRYTVTNTGAVPLTGVTLRSSLAGASVHCDGTTLAPGASTVCVATYTTTQADVAAGGVTNVATATGQPPTGPAVNSTPVSVTILTRTVPWPSLVFIPVPFPVGAQPGTARGGPGAGVIGGASGVGGAGGGAGAVAVAPAGTSPLGSQPVAVTD
ncbi:hypothetical protein I6A60_35435 [Frankia sp. AgB1.9]|uniref:DUF7507 domain-containing protein n=1 Tax=unclassified Frankia TaxID=2632575 RepID=UPI001931F662|nr:MULTISPECIES: hypothetical protein [unclassified Frankia]MBL7489323.1 hypothetical protein [Frankia sp. AgW1.1]MBL7553105.1 hypothetical protein [Frankia sp. AgB1.9]MBL7623090.1 hypothetical protein [Frankia sp. AgB1.8]